MIKKDIQESIDDIIGILNSDNNKFKEDVIKEFRKNDFLNGSKCKINENNDIDEKSQKHLNESYHNCSFNKYFNINYKK